MTHTDDPPLQGLDPDAALRSILEGTAAITGERFFHALVKSLAEAMGTHGAWVTEYLEEERKLRALAFWLGGSYLDHYETLIDGTPCEAVVKGARLLHIPDNILQIYPDEPELIQNKAVSYMGAPLRDGAGVVMGHLAVLDTRPMPAEPRAQAVFQVFAARAGAELQRLNAERALREREEKLSRLVDGAMDAILELDEGLRITQMNPAARQLLGDLAGSDFRDALPARDRGRLEDLTRSLREEGRVAAWIPGGLRARDAKGEEFPAEATVSYRRERGHAFHTLILRNVNDRLEAERRIRSLTQEAEYLREEVRTLGEFDEILGTSRPLLRVLRDIHEVAATAASVLILGETGTGKELIARAIHAASDRRARPLIKVNCAAIPATLVESEFFGHEKGAFTGATQRREGRFALADRGTIFLDEVAELPTDLQVKLLRVLQEGEFEPVGSSVTRTVDVRVLAATNRDLEKEVREGRFRQDLLYRLNVFPIQVPPLRERGDDIPLLATSFARRLGRRMGREMASLSSADVQRLKAYAWPGNVRELHNVIERAVITSRDGRLNLDRALPEEAAPPPARPPERDGTGQAVLTERQIREIEKGNILRALEASRWRVAGADGAAKRLGLSPSTLSSRMKSLGIERP